MSIKKREVFYDDTGGYVRFWDWALVTTTLGAMAEPFLPNDRHLPGKFSQFDPTDEIARIDDIRASSIDTHLQALSGGVHALNGGTLHPRDGR